MSNLSKIGEEFSTYLASISPQIKDNSLQWYLSGSLATTLMASAESITEVKLDSENNVIEEAMPKEVTEEQRKKIATFTRKLGVDIDVVNVNGDLFSGAPPTDRPHIQNVVQNVPDVLDLMSWNPSLGGSMYIDRLEAERDISHHPVAKVKTANGYVYVTAPPEQLAHKLAETIQLSRQLAKKQVPDGIEEHYEKDIKDLSSMFYGFKDLYENEEFLNRVYDALNEKEDSLFSINNPIYNSENMMKGQEILDTHIIRRIVEDSGEHLRTIADDKSEAELNDFFNKLLSRRRSDVEKITKNQSIHNLTPLQQRETELSSLEEEARGYDEELKSIEQEGLDIGE